MKIKKIDWHFYIGLMIFGLIIVYYGSFAFLSHDIKDGIKAIFFAVVVTWGRE